MHVLSLVPAFAGLTAALTIQSRQSTAAPASVSIAGIAFAGSGCAASSLGASAVKEPGVIPVPRKVFVAKSGEGNTKVVETRVNCQSTISLNHTAGWQYSVSEADYYGRVVLALGAEAISKTTYYFSGNTAQVRFASLSREPKEGGRGLTTTNTHSNPSSSTLTARSTASTSATTAGTPPRACGRRAARAACSTSTPRSASRPSRACRRASRRAWRDIIFLGTRLR